MSGQAIVLAREQFENPVESAMAEECVRGWVNGLREVTATNYRYLFRAWLRYLWRQPGWAGKKPSELLEFQESATGRKRIILQSFMRSFIQDERSGTYQSMKVKLAHLRSFFLANGIDNLPSSRGWNPEPTREETEGRLDVHDVREIILHARIRDQAIFLTMFQGLMDLERFYYFNTHYAEKLVQHLKSEKLDEPFRVDFHQGRKRNHRRFYTFIYRDALEAWKGYFDRIRGSWPSPGEALAMQAKRPDLALTKRGIPPLFNTVARQLKLKPERQKDKGFRTGVACHEAFRDVTRSLLQTAKKKSFDMTCAEFWMGHSIDPYNYNKFAELHPEYVLENGKIASEYLNILSGSIARNDQEVETLRELVKQQGEGLRKLQGQFEVLRQGRIASET